MGRLIDEEYLIEHVCACMENDRLMKTATKDEILRMIEDVPTAQPEQAVKDCRNCKHGKYNDYHDTYFCYNAEDCSNWDKWETSAQPVHIPLNTDDIFDAEIAKRILNNK